MATMDLAALTAPIDADEPCGPDLEAEDDNDFLNFFASVEMALPDQYFVVDDEDDGKRKPFHSTGRFKELNLKTYSDAAAKLLGRTRDLRVLSLAAKVEIFDRKLTGFETGLEATAAWLETWWADVHPGPDDRSAVLERLNEQFTVVTALNNAPLFRSKRLGLLSRQLYLAKVREAGGGREDADPTTVDRVLIEERKADPSSIEEAQAVIGRLDRALGRINAVCAEKLGAGAPDLRLLCDTVAKIRGILDRINPPPEVPGEGSDGGEGAEQAGTEARATGGLARFDTPEAAAQALAIATRFLAETEPSSPALLLLRQAQALVGKSFLDALNALLPDHVRQATLSVGPLPIFNLPLQQLSDRGLSAEDASRDDDAEAPPEEEPPPPRPAVASRAEALALLDRVGAHYGSIEPSSPIPLLIDRARALVGKDFMSLIRTILSESALRGE